MHEASRRTAALPVVDGHGRSPQPVQHVPGIRRVRRTRGRTAVPVRGVGRRALVLVQGRAGAVVVRVRGRPVVVRVHHAGLWHVLDRKVVHAGAQGGSRVAAVVVWRRRRALRRVVRRVPRRRRREEGRVRGLRGRAAACLEDALRQRRDAARHAVRLAAFPEQRLDRVALLVSAAPAAAAAAATATAALPRGVRGPAVVAAAAVAVVSAGATVFLGTLAAAAASPVPVVAAVALLCEACLVDGDGLLRRVGADAAGRACLEEEVPRMEVCRQHVQLLRLAPLLGPRLAVQLPRVLHSLQLQTPFSDVVAKTLHDGLVLRGLLADRTDDLRVHKRLELLHLEEQLADARFLLLLGLLLLLRPFLQHRDHPLLRLHLLLQLLQLLGARACSRLFDDDLRLRHRLRRALAAPSLPVQRPLRRRHLGRRGGRDGGGSGGGAIRRSCGFFAFGAALLVLPFDGHVFSSLRSKACYAARVARGMRSRPACPKVP
eukprot:Rhum_TRINITY_DN14728_c0_g1::Rhum_TRINITY_DN14728_c0_g1_i2::g.111721::m.111721